jgi:pyridoxamine 5'-phosphate oxidase
MTNLDELIDRFEATMQRAQDAGLELPNGAALATVGSDGRPSVRIVLLKSVEHGGFVFYTNLGSRKARELEANPHAALCFWWPPLDVQIRIEGVVEKVQDGEADSYWKSRPRGSQLGAWASRQSEPLPSHESLVQAFEALELKYRGREVPRPDFWSGFRLVPDRIEFWRGRDDRLHVRELYARVGEVWKKTLLNP